MTFAKKCGVAFLFPFVLIVFFGCGNKRVAAPEPVTPVTFAVFGNSGLAADGGKTLCALATSVNGDSVAFIVDLGNRLGRGLTSAGIDALWEMVDRDRERFNAPVFTIPGGNDIFDFNSDIVYESRYGDSWYSFRRNGVLFVFLNTEDESYRGGFTDNGRIGGEQTAWLEKTLNTSRGAPVVVFMHRPLWIKNPALWGATLRPLFKRGGVVLVVTADDGGLYDWGEVDGIRAVSTGCVGPVDDAGIGLFPHAVIVTIGDGEARFSVLVPDGAKREGIAIDSAMKARVDSLVAALHLPPLVADAGWNVNTTHEIVLQNTFDAPLTGELSFDTFRGANWQVSPETVKIAVESGTTTTYRVNLRATPPDLGPQPDYHATLSLGGRKLCDFESPVTVRIPEPRTDSPITIKAVAADVLPYAFDGKSLRIPVETDGYDNCGRCVIYRYRDEGLPECIHISPLKDFRPGVNEFVWNGVDRAGDHVSPDSLVYRVFVYNKKAPATWAAVGPPDAFGSAMIRRSMGGTTFVTHDERSVAGFSVGASSGARKPETIASLDAILGTGGMTAFANDDRDRLYIASSSGIACTIKGAEGFVPDQSFGDGGYVVLSDFRGRTTGGLAYASGVLYFGIGGDMGAPPSIIAIDAVSGDVLDVLGFGEWFGEDENPPAFALTSDGLICAHPDYGTIVRTNLFGEALWTAGEESGTNWTGSDGRSFIYGIGVDDDDFSYVNTPGTSARCAVIGPDGIDLFRVILVSLPGLRVGAVVPSIAGEPSDGLFFVTRGGDRPYVFHVPFTVRKGLIVDEAEYTKQ